MKSERCHNHSVEVRGPRRSWGSLWVPWQAVEETEVAFPQKGLHRSLLFLHHDHLWTSHQDHRSPWGCLFLPACHQGHLCHGHHLRLEKVVEGTLRALDCIATLVAFCFPGEVLASPTWTRALPVSRSDLDVLRKCVFLNVIVNLSLIQFITHQKVCHIWF